MSATRSVTRSLPEDAFPLYVGIDVGKETLLVAWCESQQKPPSAQSYTLQSCRNCKEDIDALLTTIRERAATRRLHLLFEPTGCYSLYLLAAAFDHAAAVTQVNARQVRRWADGLGQRAKTDPQDARMLALYGEMNQPDAEEEVPLPIQQLDQLLHRRDDLKALLQAEKNRRSASLHHPSPATGLFDSYDRIDQALRDEIEHIDAEINALLRAHPSLRQERRLLFSVPGIGERLSLILLVLFYRFRARTAGHAGRKQLTAYLGLDPRPHQSGARSRHAFISSMGNSSARSMLYMGALGGSHGNSPLRSFYLSLCQRGKPPKLALTACARKSLVWAWAVFTTNQPFDPKLAMPNLDRSL